PQRPEPIVMLVDALSQFVNALLSVRKRREGQAENIDRPCPANFHASWTIHVDKSFRSVAIRVIRDGQSGTASDEPAEHDRLVSEGTPPRRDLPVDFSEVLPRLSHAMRPASGRSSGDIAR